MTIKVKVFFTVLLGLVYLLFSKAYALVDSPIRGVVTANQLNDTTSSYVAAQAVQNNYAQNIGLIVTFAILCGIWLLVPNKNQK